MRRSELHQLVRLSSAGEPAAAEFAGQKFGSGLFSEREGREDLRVEALDLGRNERSRAVSSLELIPSLKLSLLAFYELRNVRDRQEGWGNTNIV